MSSCSQFPQIFGVTWQSPACQETQGSANSCSVYRKASLSQIITSNKENNVLLALVIVLLLNENYPFICSMRIPLITFAELKCRCSKDIIPNKMYLPPGTSSLVEETDIRVNHCNTM